MKKMLLGMLICGILLTACGTAPKSTESVTTDSFSASYAPLDPYRVLDFPKNLTFGMHRDEVMEITGALPTTVRSTVEYNPRIYLDHYCMVSRATYLFNYEDVDEFEDGSILDTIQFRITDIVPYSERTKEHHGDVDAEYDTVYARLEEKYGEPDIIIEDGQEYEKLRRSVWKNEDGMGIILNLNKRTSVLDTGTLVLTYLNPTNYKKSWVDDFGN